jgi:hypothetical protein
MAFYAAVTTTLSLTGSTSGVCTVTTVTGLARGATAYLSATGLPTLPVTITNIKGSQVALRAQSKMPCPYGTDISAYTTALTATLYMPSQSAWSDQNPISDM